MYKSYSQIVKPNRVEPLFLSEDGSNGSFLVQPIQRGFGVTIGNSLRRVLLSSIRGTLISSVTINDIEQEFSVIPGVKQDVARICLSLRNVIIKSEQESCEGLLEVKGPIVVTASMIQLKEGFEILNGDLPLFEVEKDVPVKMKFKIESGVGTSFKEIDSKNQNLGEIDLDCHFSPVKSVKFSVKDARVDKFTDYDSLNISVETNGSIKADDALGLASGILRDMLEIFINFDATRVLSVEETAVVDDSDVYNLNLLRKTEDLELSVRSVNCFSSASIKYIGDLVRKTESEMLKMNNFGRKSLEEIKTCLSHMGLSLGMDIGEWPPKDMPELLILTKKRFGN
ncbi:MAG: DNA-directed RNA polymerase subunit alpha [Alphaproteobacteria bacterium]|nr:DNA-directed RNA polymerase subunit alpha [Rickettsiales bacterium]